MGILTMKKSGLLTVNYNLSDLETKVYRYPIAYYKDETKNLKVDKNDFYFLDKNKSYSTKQLGIVNIEIQVIAFDCAMSLSEVYEELYQHNLRHAGLHELFALREQQDDFMLGWVIIAARQLWINKSSNKHIIYAPSLFNKKLEIHDFYVDYAGVYENKYMPGNMCFATLKIR